MYAVLALVFGSLVASSRMPQVAAPQAPQATTVKVGDVVNGEVTKDSPVVHTPTLDQGYTDTPVRGVSYTLELPAGATTIELHSYFFDAYLVVRDAKGELVAEDDDGLLRTHARVVMKLDAAKTCEVTACALHGDDGPFELRVATGAAPVLDARQRKNAEIDDARRQVQLVETSRGPEHPDTARSLNDLASLLAMQGKYEEARPLYERALTIRETVLGPEHPDTATSLGNLAWLLQAQGKYEEARPLFERALAIQEKVSGPSHPDTGRCLNNLAALLFYEGKYEQARPLYERALSIQEKVFGPKHRSTAASLNNLAALLFREGKYEDARPLFERVLAIEEKALGPEHPETGRILNNLAELLRDEGQYEEARPLYERALAIREKVLGSKHPDTVATLSSLALLLVVEGKYAEAQPRYERVLAIQEKVLGPEHPETAKTLNNLASSLRDEGKYEEARPLFERALAIREKVLGPGHPDTANSLNEVALLLEAEGKYEEARPLYERELAIHEKVLGPEHPDTARSLNNVAEVLAAEAKYEEARPFYERALAIKEKVLGPEHPATAMSLNNIAKLLCHEGKYEEARPFYERALAIREKVLGPEHPDAATSLNNLAKLLEAEGKYEEARPLLERALAIQEKVLGPEHPDAATSLNNLAFVLLDLGKPVEARERARKHLASVSAHSLIQASLASDADAMRWIGGRQDALAFLLAATPPSDRSSDELYSQELATRGGAFQLLKSRRKGIESSRDPALHAKLEELRVVGAALSNLFSRSEVKAREQFDRDVERLRKRRVDLEAELARAFDARPELQPVTPAAVRSQLPKDAVLLDFLDHWHYEPAEWKDGSVVKLGQWGERRFSVWISRGGATTSTWLDLGPSPAIEKAIADYLAIVVGVVEARGAGGTATIAENADATKTRRGLADRLRRLVWDPIAAEIRRSEGASRDGAVKQVILSPDGALATLPFGAIEGEDGEPLIEKYAFSCVEEAASLARPSRAPSVQDPTTGAAQHVPSLLVAGAVDYDQGAQLDESKLAANQPRGERRGSFTFTWNALSETRHEADGVAATFQKRFGDAACLQLMEAEPCEERLKVELPKYAILHLATHGYYLAQGLRSITDAIRDENERADFETQERRMVAGYWPQFLCGLVCAGANHPQPDRDNGLLTGDEVGDLDLSRCDLVVLSACETALGNRQTGEGLLSLTRSFQEAGARTVISSLWQVCDDSTRELMLDFYDRLWNQHENKLDALRDAQLHMLKENRAKYGDTRPATWGAFVLTGEAE